TLDNGTILYRFAHVELGELGCLRIAPVPCMVPPGMTHVSAEMAPSDPDEDEQWNQNICCSRRWSRCAFLRFQPRIRSHRHSFRWEKRAPSSGSTSASLSVSLV